MRIGHWSLVIGNLLLDMSHCRACICGQVAAIHRNDGTGDPGGSVGSEKDGESLNIVGFAQPPRGNATQPLRFKRWVGYHSLFEAGIYHLRRQERVDADALAGPFGTQLPRHLHDRSHGHTVGDMSAPQR